MAVGQFITSAATGNIGFAVEAAHNTSDAVSFDAKRRAMGSPRKARRLRRFAATILTVGGVAGVGGGVYQATHDKLEDSGNIALGIAVAGATINTMIAKRTHRAHNHQHGPCGAHEDTKLHAVTDAGTGWLYVGGLALEQKYPGIANYAVALNGFIVASAGAMTHKNISETQED